MAESEISEPDRKIKRRKSENKSSQEVNSQSDYVESTSEASSPETDGTPLSYVRENMFYSTEGRGQGIIIVNQKFPGKADRKGAEKDVEHLKKIYDHLDIDYSAKSWCEDKENVWRDIEEHEMYKKMKTFSENIELHCPVIFVSISSHGGDNGDVMGSEGRCIRVSELIECFQNKAALLGIPKVFIIQACKGSATDTRECVGDSYKGATTKIVEYATRQADTLIAYSTSEGCVSFRSPAHGSWFIEVLRDALLDSKYDSWHLVEILAMCTNHIINQYSDQMFTETPSYQSTLRKFLRFNRKQS